MTNRINDELNESYVQEGIDAGLLDSRANLFCVWKMQREGHGTVDEYLSENTLNLPIKSQLSDTLNIVRRRNDSLKETVRQLDETIEQLNEQNRLLKKEVNLSEEKVNNAYKRIAEYANKAYMKRLGDADTELKGQFEIIKGELIDVA